MARLGEDARISPERRGTSREAGQDLQSSLQLSRVIPGSDPCMTPVGEVELEGPGIVATHHDPISSCNRDGRVQLQRFAAMSSRRSAKSDTVEDMPKRRDTGRSDERKRPADNPPEQADVERAIELVLNRLRPKTRFAPKPRRLPKSDAMSAPEAKPVGTLRA
ncbi:hypothetical protein [Methylobacterium nigriterrae]|uniref:hypothetical protein n=1 Tax=Methylobacterium nigriterrae TaxID=3127512 RepID=UPI003013C1CA